MMYQLLLGHIQSLGKPLCLWNDLLEIVSLSLVVYPLAPVYTFQCYFPSNQMFDNSCLDTTEPWFHQTQPIWYLLSFVISMNHSCHLLFCCFYWATHFLHSPSFLPSSLLPSLMTSLEYSPNEEFKVTLRIKIVKKSLGHMLKIYWFGDKWDGSAVKSICYSCIEPELTFPHPYSG